MSIAVRRALSKALVRARLEAGKSVADVVVTGIVAKSTLQSIEGAERPIKVAHVMSLCQIYNVDAETTAELVRMAKNVEKGWWEDFRDVLHPKFLFFVQLESAADRVFTYDSELLYGLLQTPAYHRAVHAGDPALSEDSADREVEFRSGRQRATLGREPALTITSIINEAVLVREVGGEKVMAEQRTHLLELNSRPNIDLFVVPWSAGAHAAMRGPFQIMGFDHPDNPDVAYLETYEGVRYLEEDDRIQEYRDRIDHLRHHTVTIEEYLK
jgi:hypothetical protein